MCSGVRGAAPAAGLYKGVTLSAAGTVPYLAVSFAAYDELKALLPGRKASRLEWWYPVAKIGCGAAAAVIAQARALPAAHAGVLRSACMRRRQTPVHAANGRSFGALGVASIRRPTGESSCVESWCRSSPTCVAQSLSRGSHQFRGCLAHSKAFCGLALL